MKRLIATLACACLLLAGISRAWAHDPFDGNIETVVYPGKIETKVTIGYDAARALFRSLGLPPVEAARMTRSSPDGQLVRLPAGLANRVVTLHAAGIALAPHAFLVAPSDAEVTLYVIHQRPAAQAVALHAAYFDGIADMRPGLVVVADDARRLLATATVTRDRPDAVLPLAAAAAAARPAATMERFPAFFRLGVEHILTGFDHLLFLCALLVGVASVRTMLGIVTAFTVSHSITLALSALDVVSLPPALVEPAIALSIIAACVGNVVRRDGGRDRYWLAGGFGLLHGFGFAGALRAAIGTAPGASVALPVLSFNLGVEAGQLLVAAVVIPLLMLARKRTAFARHGVATVSAAIIAVSWYWLMQRLNLT